MIVQCDVPWGHQGRKDPELNTIEQKFLTQGSAAQSSPFNFARNDSHHFTTVVFQ